jgi:xanthine/uracil permease
MLANVTATSSAIAAVPEPATWAIMLVGFGMVGAASRYRRWNVDASLA